MGNSSALFSFDHQVFVSRDNGGGINKGNFTIFIPPLPWILYRYQLRFFLGRFLSTMIVSGEAQGRDQPFHVLV